MTMSAGARRQWAGATPQRHEVINGAAATMRHSAAVWQVACTPGDAQRAQLMKWGGSTQHSYLIRI